MVETIKKTIKMFDEITSKTFNDFKDELYNGNNEPKIQYDDIIPKDRVLSDINAMVIILKDIYNNNTFDDFTTIFAVYCNIYLKYSMNKFLNKEEYKINILQDVINDQKKLEYLKLIQDGIASQLQFSGEPISYFSKAVDLFPENNLPYLYLFLYKARMFYNSKNDLKIKNEMLVFYSKMGTFYQEYAIGNSSLIVSSYNSTINYSPLPYLKFSNTTENEIMALISDYNNIRNMFNMDDFCENTIQKLIHGLATKDENLENKYISLEMLMSRLQDLWIKYNSRENNCQEYNNCNTESDNTQEDNSVKFDITDMEVNSFFDENGDFFEGMAMNLHLLGIPYIIELSSAYDTQSLIKMEMDLEIAIKEKELAIQQKNIIVRDFTHTYGNMKLNTLYDIAKILMESDNPEYKNMGGQLLIEYGIRQGLTKDVYMLRLKFDNNSEHIQKILQESIAIPSDEDAMNIEDIINSALLICLLRILYIGTDRDGYLIRQQIKKIKTDLLDLRNSYEKDVIFSKKSAIRWVNEKLFIINFNIDDSWKKLCLHTDSYSVVFFRDLFVEFLFNMFKYANKQNPIKFNLKTKKIVNRKYLYVEMINSMLKNINSYSGEGLKSKSEILNIINKRNDHNENINYLITEKKDNLFYTKALLDDTYFLR